MHIARIVAHSLCRRGLGRDADLDWIGQESITQFCNRLWHGRGKEQALPLTGQQLVDALQGLDEAQIHHLVRFVEHENLDIAKMHGLLIDKVEQTAWRCHENVDASLHLLDLATDRDARSEEHTSELQSLMRKSYAGCCLKK